MTAQTQEELLAAHLEQQAIDVYSLSLTHKHTHTIYIESVCYFFEVIDCFNYD